MTGARAGKAARRVLAAAVCLGGILSSALAGMQGGPAASDGSFLPRSSPPARRLTVVRLHGLKPEAWVALTCLQGLLAREQPRLFLVRSPTDEWILDWHRSKGWIDGWDETTNWPALFAEYAPRLRGAVIPDPDLAGGELLAANVAACEDAIVAPPALAAQLGLRVAVDLRGRYATFHEGLRAIWAERRTQLHPRLCDFREPGLFRHATFDYAYQWRGLMFWVSGKVDGAKRGADPKSERATMDEILAALGPGGACVGFPAGGEGVGIGEPPGVELLSRHGWSLVCNNHLSNSSFLTGIRVSGLHVPAELPPPPLRRDRIYIALVMSDGDNEILWPQFFRRYIEHPAAGRFPLSFGMGPAIAEFQPGVAQWYFEHAPRGTAFIADVSGAGYMQPDRFGEACADREAAWSGFLGETARLMQSLGQRSIRTVGGKDEHLERYARALPFCHSLFADMGRYSGRSGITNLTYALSGGMPVFRSVTSWRYGKEGFLREIREQVGSQRPAFVNGFVHCWTFDMDALAKIHEQRDPDMEFVTPAQLAALYRESLEPQDQHP